MKKIKKVFVYGTLRLPRAGTAENDTRYYPQIQDFVISAAPARLYDAVLYDMGTFPAAIPGEGVIFGDLLDVQPAAIKVMDGIEGAPYFYIRKPVVVKTNSGEQEAWIYWAPEGMASEGVLIQSGDWLDRNGVVLGSMVKK